MLNRKCSLSNIPVLFHISKTLFIIKSILINTSSYSTPNLFKIHDIFSSFKISIIQDKPYFKNRMHNARERNREKYYEIQTKNTDVLDL